MDRIVFATKNMGKFKEVKHIFKDSMVNLVSLNELDDVPEIIESGETFEENARIKAEVIFNKFGVPVIADDSGISVDQLDGRPGVYSARYSGEGATDEANNEKLLCELKNFPEPHSAKFVCSAVYFDGEKFLTAYGEVKGRIIKSPRGKNGFGYDPLFLPDGFDRTSGELELDEKNRISHRAKAFNKLKTLINK